jgi:hypothetical protein
MNRCAITARSLKEGMQNARYEPVRDSHGRAAR